MVIITFTISKTYAAHIFKKVIYNELIIFRNENELLVKINPIFSQIIEQRLALLHSVFDFLR